ncbi:histone-lysine N-methyltransferase SETMAR [Trichonephila clavipes]|nr:histone-lysine N-methyltransferase SETMAR [Trichonephila clavipes]
MERRMSVWLEQLVRFHEDGNDFLFRIVMRDESWVHHFTPEVKEGHINGIEKSVITWPKEVQNNPSASKVLLTVFWDAQGVLLLDFLKSGTINATRYCDTLLKSQEAIRKK